MNIVFSTEEAKCLFIVVLFCFVLHFLIYFFPDFHKCLWIFKFCASFSVHFLAFCWNYGLCWPCDIFFWAMCKSYHQIQRKQSLWKGSGSRKGHRQLVLDLQVQPYRKDLALHDSRNFFLMYCWGMVFLWGHLLFNLYLCWHHGFSVEKQSSVLRAMGVLPHKQQSRPGASVLNK